MSKCDGPKLVTALFSFKGKNNDELCFKKGEIITITQTDDGGWWEGTLNDKTGWFPSNYVKEYRAPDSGSTSAKMSPEKSSPDSPLHQTLNRDIVLKDIGDSERANVAELQGLVNNFLQPLEAANVLKKEDYKQLTGNFHEILEIHQCLLVSLDNALCQGQEARVGNIFLTLAPKLKSVHTTYCNCHPQAVCILDRYRDELNDFMERVGAISPGILVLTTGLSKPFRRLDKYSAMLQELERHTEKNHPDRGDTQRSVSVYRDIAERCASIRKQRELALQILTSGIKGWEGEELNVLGDIIHVGAVILASGVDRRDRYFVLFPTTLLVLSTSARMSSFVYEGKLPLTGIHVVAMEQLEDIKNAFEISGPMIETITVLCPSREERQHWIELLSQEQIAIRASHSTRSPTIISHVSCCSHPPYTRLSRFFARLVRKRVIHPELLKKLLYFQYIFRPDLSSVRLRKRCVVSYALFPANHPISPSPVKPSSEQSRPPRKSSTLKLDVRYVLEERPILEAQRLELPLSTCASMAAFGSEPFAKVPELSSRSLPPKMNMESCIMPNFDSVPYRELRSGEAKRELLDLCESESSKNWRSLGKQQPQTRRVEVQVSLGPTSSPRSTDSGMADSFQYHSTELGSGFKLCQSEVTHSESENDENKFENQCICSSPFGSTPRQSSSSESSPSACKSYLSSRVKRTVLSEEEPTSSEDEEEDDTDEESDEEKDDLGKVCTCRLEEEEAEAEMKEKDVVDRRFANLMLIKQKHLTQPLPVAKPDKLTKSRRVRRPAAYREPNKPDADAGGQVFTSGLYAHWWLKKTIPTTDQVKQPEFQASSSRSGALFISRD